MQILGQLFHKNTQEQENNVRYMPDIQDYMPIFAALKKINVKHQYLTKMKYIAYYRVSTNKQSLGIDAQRNAVEQFISSSKDNVLIASFEEKESGKNANRTELNNALLLAKKEDACLLIAKLDRLSRDVAFLFNLQKNGIEFRALDLPQFNTLTLGIFATIAQYERELISSRTKAALSELKKKGVKLGAPKCYLTDEIREYAHQRSKEIAMNNPNNIRSKAFIEALLKQNKRVAEIADELNENGFLTSQGCKFNKIQVYRLIKMYKLK